MYIECRVQYPNNLILFYFLKYKFCFTDIITMFGLRNRKKMHSSFLSNKRFLINITNVPHKKFENIKQEDGNELQSKLSLAPIETFSSETAGLELPQTKMSTVVETTNSDMVNKLQRGFTADNLKCDKSEVNPVHKKEPSDNEFIVSKSEDSINPHSEKNLIHTAVRHQNKNKKRKTSIYDIPS